MSEENYVDFVPDEWEFCDDGFCNVCEMKYRCVDSPYYRQYKA